MALGIAFSFGALLVEERAFQRYRSWSCFGRLVLAAGIENLGYRQWYALIRVHATWAQLTARAAGWGEMARRVHSRERPLEVLKSITSGTPSSR